MKEYEQRILKQLEQEDEYYEEDYEEPIESDEDGNDSTVY